MTDKLTYPVTVTVTLEEEPILFVSMNKTYLLNTRRGATSPNGFKKL
jgi:hypothetical protein